MNNIAEENENQEMKTEELENTEETAALEMADITGEESMEELLGIYESSLKKFEEGQVVTGTVISVGRDMVLVDVGYKSEGQISIQEFIDEEGNVNVNVGDEFEVMIEVWDEEEETVLLSRDKAKKVKVWDAIKEIYDADGTIEGV
ncbi:MAG: S1 RNA-binding domain-containing protein, partial [Desulfobacterales bacterium]|nr:S1 RNA-binding domain-containing protein [Desulfobacterales bacterium]